MPDHKVTLGFDTSHAYCTGALLRGENVLAERCVEMARGQAEFLIPMLEDILCDAKLQWNDIDRIGVGVGPGNFTGIRLSVSAARGLSLGLGIPAVGVSLLDALALDYDEPIVAAISAPRSRTYIQLHGFGVVEDLGPSLMSLDDLPEAMVGKGFPCVGSASKEVASRLGGEVVPAKYPAATSIARIASLTDAATIERPAPLYLRQADASPPREAAPKILA